MIYQRKDFDKDEQKTDLSFQQANRTLKEQNHEIKMNIINTYIDIHRDTDRQQAF